ncbi:MAG: response regulator [Campylobacterota bacterium]|nr:response regulator [Campylobacterota bacterium]
MNKTIQECLSSLKVLYVEDNKIVLKSTMYMLEEFFEYIDTAENGREGIEKYKEFFKNNNSYYDIVITDINMPEMNGIEMTKIIYSLNKEQNIIVISAHNEAQYLLELINIGISNFILKPIDLSNFQEVISRIGETLCNKKRVNAYNKEIKDINKSLQIAKEKAEQASEYKSQFLANMSHEIRTPLNAISGFIGLLNEKETNSEKLKYYKIIQSASSSLTNIINDILDFSKIESGKLEVELIDFSPYDDLILTAELFKIQAIEKEIDFMIHYNDTMPKLLCSDVYKIKQVLTNLLSNAIKFTPNGSKIRFIIWYLNGKLSIRVKDYGVGIPKEKEMSIFESFSQADSSIVRKYGGSGLGLAISTKLANLLAGELTFNHANKGGSIFTLCVPVSLAKETNNTVEKTKIKENTTQKGHILVVDDIEANRMFVGIILKNVGFTYENAINGLEAIEAFKTGEYDLILMDENMPKMGGIMASKHILKLEEEAKLDHTPIVALTANALSGDRKRFLEAGMDDYLAKPITPIELIDKIQEYL